MLNDVPVCYYHTVTHLYCKMCQDTFEIVHVGCGHDELHCLPFPDLNHTREDSSVIIAHSQRGNGHHLMIYMYIDIEVVNGIFLCYSLNTWGMAQKLKTLWFWM